MMMRIQSSFFLFLLVCSPSFAYRFLCNGMEADGSEIADHCGACTNESAPRWIPSSVDVLVDLKTRPKSLTQDGWRDAVVDSMNVWNRIEGGNLELRFAGETAYRRFGSDATKHEIFWVLDKEEWRQKVGSGENATLGVTVSPYQCAAPGRVSREIYDADLIMNGASKIKWKLDCAQSGPKCESIRATLVHELGHFIGLGHPCTDCDWSIMAATSGTSVSPERDDKEGIRALYPSGLAGQLGMRCERESDCRLDLQCISHNEAKYCSQSCQKTSCPQGYSCDRNNGSVCRLAIGRFAPPAGLLERCETKPCEGELQCVQTYSDKSYCVANCFEKTDCRGRESCVLFPDGGAGICLQKAKLNESCGDLTVCDDRLICVGKNDEDGLCKTECDPKKKQCQAGTICSRVARDTWACT